MTANKSKIAGWALSALIALFLIGASGIPKFIDWDGKEEMMGKLGWDTGLILKIGVVEVAIAILFLIPRTAFLGTVLLTAYLGGAVATHVRVDNPLFSHQLFPVYIAVLIWGGLRLRDPRVRALLAKSP
jgi:hypothetical protein